MNLTFSNVVPQAVILQYTPITTYSSSYPNMCNSKQNKHTEKEIPEYFWSLFQYRMSSYQ